MQEKTLGLDDVIDYIEEFYKKIDTKLDAHIAVGITKHSAISCHKCTEPGCCLLKVPIAVMEALPIARHLKNAGLDTPELRAKLGDLGKRMEGSKSGAWLDKNIPCVFLKDKKCTIYPVRPVRCRTYWVVSPPELCQPPSEQEVSFINDAPAHEASQKESYNVHYSLGLKENAMRILRGAMPRVLLIVLEAWDSDDYRKKITRQLWPSIRKAEQGWLDGNNPFSEEVPEEDPPKTVP